MKKLRIFYLLPTIILLLFSCKDGTDGINGINGMDGIDGIDGINGMDGMNNLRSEIVVIEENPNGEPIVVAGASSELYRNANGITVNFKTENLIPNNTYTMWFVVFGDAPGPPSSTYAAGLIVGESGKGKLSGHISVGDIFDYTSLLKVFNNPLTAEVHVALRTHGPVQPGMIPEQIQTLEGGCLTGFPTGPGLHPDSDVVGYCANVQVAKHLGN